MPTPTRSTLFPYTTLFRSEPWREDDLYALMRRAAPYAGLPREDFDAVVEMLAEGVQTGRGRRGAYLHRDRVNGMVRSEEHTFELQSLRHLVCRLLLENKNT